MQHVIDNNNDVDNGESVPVEYGTSTPTSGEYIECCIAENEEQRLLTTQEILTLAIQEEGAQMTENEELRLMNTYELLTPATKEEGVVSTTVTSTPPLGEDSDHLEQVG